MLSKQNLPSSCWHVTMLLVTAAVKHLHLFNNNCRLPGLSPPQILRASPADLTLRPAGDPGREEPGADLQGAGPQHWARQTPQVDQPPGPGHTAGRQVGPQTTPRIVLTPTAPTTSEHFYLLHSRPTISSHPPRYLYFIGIFGRWGKFTHNFLHW